MLIIPVFAAPSSIDYPARALINGVVMTLDTKEDTPIMVYPGASHYGHMAVSQGIPKGIPLWPYGRFTRYKIHPSRMDMIYEMPFDINIYQYL